MPALLPIVLTASHIVLAADAVPKFNVEQTCRRAGEVSVSLGRSAGDCKRDEEDAHSKLQQDCSIQSGATHRLRAIFFARQLAQLRRIADLPRDGEAGEGAARSVQDGHVRAALAIRISCRAAC